MEALGVVAVAGAIASVVQIANEFYRISKNIRDHNNPKIKIIQYDLMVQRQRTINWAHRLQVEGIETWQIPPQASRTVQTILIEMEDYFRRAEKRMARLYSSSEGKLTSRSFFERYLFNTGGFEELKDLTGALKAMNELLDTIAPPLPKGSPFAFGAFQPEYSSFRASDLFANVEKETRRHIGEKIKSERNPSPSISLIYSQCFESLSCISRQLPNNIALRKLTDKLRLWGVTLFQSSSLALDTIIGENLTSNHSVGHSILRALVYIAVAEERIMKQLCEVEKDKNGDLDQTSQLTNSWISLSAMLGRENIAEIAVERWTNILDSRSEDLLEGGTEGALSSADENGGDNVAETYTVPAKTVPIIDQQRWKPRLVVLGTIKSELDSIDRSIDYSFADQGDVEQLQIREGVPVQRTEVEDLQDIVECLFELLPPIRAMRRAKLLQMEPDHPKEALPSTAKIAAPLKEQVIPKDEPVPLPTFQQMLDHSLELASSLEALLRKDEKYAKRRGMNVVAYAPEVKRELLKLEAFKSRAAQEQNREGMQELVDIVGNLGRALKRVITDISVSMTPESKYHLVVKQDSEEKTNELIQGIIKIFEETNDALYKTRLVEDVKHPLTQKGKLVAV